MLNLDTESDDPMMAKEKHMDKSNAEDSLTYALKKVLQRYIKTKRGRKVYTEKCRFLK